MSILLTQAAADPFMIDLNSLMTGGTGAAFMAALIFVGKLIADRTIPSRSDARANVTLVLEGLNNMVKVLQEEKLADSKRLDDKQARIDVLEAAADQDYDRIQELRTEIIDLRQRLAQKDRHINTLVSELRKLGAHVAGLELADADVEIEVTMPKSQVQRVSLEVVSGDNQKTAEVDIT